MKQSLKIEIPIKKILSQGWVGDYIYDEYGLDEVLSQKDEALALSLLMKNSEFFSFIHENVEGIVNSFVDEYLKDDYIIKFPLFEEVLAKSKDGKMILSKIDKALKKEGNRALKEEKDTERKYIDFLESRGYVVSQTGFSE